MSSAVHNNYYNNETYMSTALQFLNKYQWLFKYPNTHLIVNKVLGNFPSEWIDCFRRMSEDDLTNLGVSGLDTDLPESLQSFIKELQSLCPNYLIPDIERFDILKRAGVGRKKLLEITAFAPFVHYICQKNEIDYIIDIGAGLGYLTQLLHEKYNNYKILGIEGSEKYVKTAQDLQQKLYPNSLQHVKYQQHFVIDTSAANLSQFLSHHYPEFDQSVHRVAIIGLHACADLSVVILDLFKSLTSAKTLVIMPCCYHRLQEKVNVTTEGNFVRFPVSKLLRRLHVELSAGKFLDKPFLRLACQESEENSRVMGHNERSLRIENCLYRAVLQEVVEKARLKISRNKRKTGTTTSFSISEAVNILDTNFSFTRLDPENLDPINIAEIEDNVLKLWRENYEENIHALQAYSALQSTLQALCEHLVLLDRVVYSCENELNGCIWKIIEQKVSPRCFAMVVKK